MSASWLALRTGRNGSKESSWRPTGKSTNTHTPAATTDRTAFRNCGYTHENTTRENSPVDVLFGENQRNFRVCLHINWPVIRDFCAVFAVFLCCFAGLLMDFRVRWQMNRMIRCRRRCDAAVDRRCHIVFGGRAESSIARTKKYCVCCLYVRAWTRRRVFYIEDTVRLI